MFLCSNIGNVIGIVRPIRRTVTLVEASANGESRIADNLCFSPVWDWKFTWLPRFHKFFNSFNAPARDELPCKITPKDELKAIRKSFRKKG